jgi:hypothetical protein
MSLDLPHNHFCACCTVLKLKMTWRFSNEEVNKKELRAAGNVSAIRAS